MAKKSMNKVILTGNLGKDPVIRKTQDGSPVATTTLAVNGYNDDVSWANLVAFKKTAELFEEYLHKGDAIGVVGRYQVRSYEYEGETRYSHEIVVEDVTFLGGPNGNGKKNGSSQAEAPARGPRDLAGFDDDDEPRRPAKRSRAADDDIPF